MLPAVEGTLGYVCGVIRGLLWRGLGIEPPQVCNFFSWPKVGYFLDRVVCVTGLNKVNTGKDDNGTLTEKQICLWISAAAESAWLLSSFTSEMYNLLISI
jgi:hypothetical protein